MCRDRTVTTHKYIATKKPPTYGDFFGKCVCIFVRKIGFLHYYYTSDVFMRQENTSLLCISFHQRH